MRGFAPLLVILLAPLGTSCGAPARAPTHLAAPPSAAAPRFEGLEGFWPTARASELLERTRELELRADLTPLSADEQRALARLLEVGEIMQRLYELSRHAEAPAVAAHLEAYAPRSEEERARLGALRSLYRLFEGPIAYTLDDERVAFAPVSPYEAARNVYPSGTTADGFGAYVEAHPEAPELTAVRTVVRRRTADALDADRAVLAAHGWLDALHPELAARLEAPADDAAYYAVPYALAYADELERASRLLFAAAAVVRAADADLADYLAQRARDLLSNDYEAGDAAWVSGRTRHLNAQIGAYETYDDHLLGQRAFHGASILIRTPGASAELEQAVARLGELEAALPGGPYERSVRTSIPIGIYDVVADYGQARGGNTASILPNEAHVTRKYGRTILIRHNVITHPAIVDAAQRRFRAAVADAHADDLGEHGNLDRTVWHEVGHYLGPKTTTSGAVVTEALGNLHNHFEELKADLVSLWLMPRLVELGVLTEARRRDAYASGVLRTLVTSAPPRTSPYQTMELMQQNWLLERGVLTFDPAAGRLRIDYDAYPDAVEAMLSAVLEIQRRGDRAAAEAFVERWARWDPAIQGVVGPRMAAVTARFWLPRYAALETRR